MRYLFALLALFALFVACGLVGFAVGNTDATVVAIRLDAMTNRCERMEKQRDQAEAKYDQLWFAIADRPLTPTPPPMPCCSEPVAVAPLPEPAPAAPPCDYCGDRCPCLVCGCGIAAKPVPAPTKEPPPGAVPVVVLGQISVPSYQTPPPGCAWVLYSDRVWRLVCQPAPVVVAPRPAVVIGVGVRVGGGRKR